MSYLLTIMFETCVTFILPWNTKGDIKQPQSSVTFPAWKKTQWRWMSTDAVILPNMYFCSMESPKDSNYTTVSKWWQNDDRTNHCYNPPPSPRTVLIQSEQKSCQNHIQHTPSLNCYRLVDATELWVPERPDTGTVSSLRQSISWTPDNNYGTHTIYTLIKLTHILSLHFNCT